MADLSIGTSALLRLADLSLLPYLISEFEKAGTGWDISRQPGLAAHVQAHHGGDRGKARAVHRAFRVVEASQGSELAMTEVAGQALGLHAEMVRLVAADLGLDPHAPMDEVQRAGFVRQIDEATRDPFRYGLAHQQRREAGNLPGD